MGKTWHYVQAGQRQGPVDTSAMNDLIRAGTVGEADLVWTDGMAEWQPAATVGAFATAFDTRAASTPPPPVPPSSAGPTTGQATRTALAALGERAKVVGRVAGERAKVAGRAAAVRIKTADAAVPAQVKVGNRRVPKLALYAAGVGLVSIVLLVGWLVVGGPSTVSAATLQERYTDLKRDASGPYDETWINVTGQVASTRYYEPTNGVAADTTHVELQTDSTKTVVCAFKGRFSNGSDLTQLSRGDTIALRGKCMGRNWVVGVFVDDCKLTAKPSSATE